LEVVVVVLLVHVLTLAEVVAVLYIIKIMPFRQVRLM
jgi:hypothetical protein